MKKVSAGVLLFALLLPAAGFAQVVKIKCIYLANPSVPITTPGYWCLSANVVGRGIAIDADDVTLDLRGFSIINDGTATQPVDSAGKVSGVYSVGGRTNLAIRNGTIRGFDYGIRLGFPQGVRGDLVIENMLVLNTTTAGISSLVIDNSTVRNNIVSGVLGHTARGIAIHGLEDTVNRLPNHSVSTIENNRVNNVRGAAGSISASVFGITSQFASNVSITNNHVVEVYRGDPSVHSAFAIQGVARLPNTGHIENNTVINSVVEGRTTGISFGHSGPAGYDGPVELSSNISGSRVYNFDTGISSLALIPVNGQNQEVTTTILSYNVVGGAGAGKALVRGYQTRNRVE